MTLRNIFLIVAGAALLALTSCRSSRSVSKDAPVQPRSTAADYTKTVTANAQQASALTARIKVRLEAGGKSLSCNGSLRMKRGEVVQFGELGNFQLLLSSSGSLTTEAFSAAQLRKPRLCFRPGALLRNLTQTVKGERITFEPGEGEDETGGSGEEEERPGGL